MSLIHALSRIVPAALLAASLSACSPKESTSDTESTGGETTDDTSATAATEGEASSSTAGEAPTTTSGDPESCDPGDAEACPYPAAPVCHPDSEVCVACVDEKDCCPGLEDPMCLYSCSAAGKCVEAV